jgi:hypothetical protein
MVSLDEHIGKTSVSSADLPAVSIVLVQNSLYVAASAG